MILKNDNKKVFIYGAQETAKRKLKLLKADIEGSELEMLKGAQNLIKKYRPKMAICVYHKKEDMITIPQFIKSLNPKYKYYLRHSSDSSNETVLYAI